MSKRMLRFLTAGAGVRDRLQVVRVESFGSEYFIYVELNIISVAM